MTNIYAIATRTRECYGHGDYGHELKIEQVDSYHKIGSWRPVFTTRSAAQHYLDGLTWKANKQVVELELIETS